MRKMILSAMAFGLVLSLTGCGEKTATPAMPAATDIKAATDKAVDKVKDAADKAADKVKDAVK